MAEVNGFLGLFGLVMNVNYYLAVGWLVLLVCCLIGKDVFFLVWRVFEAAVCSFAGVESD